MTEEEKQKINDVAKQIQEILVANKMAMTPSISIGMVEDKVESPLTPPGIIVPEPEPVILTPENNLMNQADFMQP